MRRFRRLTYYRSSANWPQSDIEAKGGLNDMIDSAREIERVSWIQHIDKDDLLVLSKRLGYKGSHYAHWSEKITMSQDRRVRYCWGRLHGRRVYFFVKYNIAYVFRQEI